LLVREFGKRCPIGLGLTSPIDAEQMSKNEIDATVNE
jgi:hypothetical protein